MSISLLVGASVSPALVQEADSTLPERSGGIGEPPARHEGRPGERAPRQPLRKKRPVRRAAGSSKGRPRNDRPRTVVLPHPGVYRAPAILRLVGKLLDRPVRVESKEINSIEIQIPNPLGRRPLTLEELKVLLAANQLWIHLWDHPEKGPIVVASASPNWAPEEITYRRVLEVSRTDFGPTWESIEATIKAHNARLPEHARRIVAVPHERTGKILLWSPKREWIEDLGKIHREVEKESDVGRPHLFSYQGRYRPAHKLETLLLDKLSDGERDRVRVTVAKWGNHVLFRTDRELEGKIRSLLTALDRPVSTRGNDR